MRDIEGYSECPVRQLLYTSLPPPRHSFFILMHPRTQPHRLCHPSWCFLASLLGVRKPKALWRAGVAGPGGQCGSCGPKPGWVLQAPLQGRLAAVRRLQLIHSGRGVVPQWAVPKAVTTRWPRCLGLRMGVRGQWQGVLLARKSKSKGLQFHSPLQIVTTVT